MPRTESTRLFARTGSAKRLQNDTRRRDARPPSNQVLVSLHCDFVILRSQSRRAGKYEQQQAGRPCSSVSGSLRSDAVKGQLPIKRDDGYARPPPSANPALTTDGLAADHREGAPRWCAWRRLTEHLRRLAT